MKQPKKLTRDQKEFLKKKGMNPDDYMFVSEDNNFMKLYEKKQQLVEIIAK
jgi:hypothetical protein